MKKDSDDLHQLVSALTPAEKRYCSVYLKKHNSSGDNRYLQLFNHLQSESEYNALSIRKKMKYEKKANHFAVLKKQLYEQLLDALYQFSLYSDAEEQLLKSIYQCNLLLYRGLISQSEKRIEQLEKTALAMESGVGLLKIQDIKMSIIVAKRYGQVTHAGMDECYKQTQKVIDSLASISRSFYLKSKLFKIQDDSGVRSKESASKMKKVLRLMELNDRKRLPSVRSMVYYYEAKSAYYYQNMETQKSLECLEQILELLENNRTITFKARTYQVALINYLKACMFCKKWERFGKNLQKLKNLNRNHAPEGQQRQEVDPFHFIIVSNIEMHYLLNTAKFDLAYLSAKKIKSDLAMLGERVPKHDRISLRYIMAYICFVVDKYDEALDHLTSIIQEREDAVAENIQLMARVLQLICHFEKGDKILAASLVKSLQRSFRDMNSSADILRAITSFIHSSLRKVKLEPGNWIEFQDKLDELWKNKPPEGFEGLFATKVWATAHATGNSFREVWTKQ